MRCDGGCHPSVMHWSCCRFPFSSFDVAETCSSSASPVTKQGGSGGWGRAGGVKLGRRARWAVMRTSYYTTRHLRHPYICINASRHRYLEMNKTHMCMVYLLISINTWDVFSATRIRVVKCQSFVRSFVRSPCNQQDAYLVLRTSYIHSTIST